MGAAAESGAGTAGAQDCDGHGFPQQSCQRTRMAGQCRARPQGEQPAQNRRQGQQHQGPEPHLQATSNPTTATRAVHGSASSSSDGRAIPIRPPSNQVSGKSTGRRSLHGGRPARPTAPGRSPAAAPWVPGTAGPSHRPRAQPSGHQMGQRQPHASARSRNHSPTSATQPPAPCTKRRPPGQRRVSPIRIPTRCSRPVAITKARL